MPDSENFGKEVAARFKAALAHERAAGETLLTGESVVFDYERRFVRIDNQVRIEDDRRTSTQPSTPPTTPAQLGNTPLLPFDIQDSNTKINLRAGIAQIDGGWGIEAWVTNLTDEVTRGVTFSTTLRSGSRSAFPQEPRMYGVTLRGEF